MRSCRRGILFGVYCAFDQSLTRVTSAFPPTLFALCLRVCVFCAPPPFYCLAANLRWLAYGQERTRIHAVMVCLLPSNGMRMIAWRRNPSDSLHSVPHHHTV